MPDILVVSHDADLLFRIEERAAKARCRVKSCIDVTKALEWLELKAFAAVVTDESISIEAQQKIAGALWAKAAVAPFYVVSLNPPDRKQDGGVRLFGAEPVRGPDALDSLERLLGALADEGKGGAPEALKILVVEDLDAARDIICSYVEGLGYPTVAGDRSAASALGRLENDAAAASCIITDIRMPDMDGKELITRLRHDARFRHLPIIVLTAYGTADMLIDCLRAGASGFLIKPPKRSDLIRELARAQRINRRHLDPRLAQPQEVEELRDLLADRGLV